MSRSRAFLILGSVVACSPPARPVPPPAPAARPEVLACLDLPADDPRSHNLSGLAWDGAAHRLYSISDRDRSIIVLAPDPTFTRVELQPSIALDIPQAAWDAEAVVLAGERFLVVANETEAAAFSVDRTGHDARPLALPPFPGIVHNLGLESLGFRDGFVFAANEEALTGDGPLATASAGTVIRIVRRPLAGGADRAVAYRTEPIFAVGAKRSENGVSDLLPLGADRVLVIERAWVEDTGNAVRIFEVDLRGAPDVLGVADARTVAAARKRLVVDIGGLPEDRCPPSRSAQQHRTLENYEGIALGPVLPDGRQVMFLLADDNGGKRQSARMLTLALPPGAL
ncbi:MAG TPA: esterase-like activity of phytase family protein [Kofleriaceae bacterium]|nr:esterase-like activity of phytase family protein [Kofleriaceae bacterium]